MLTIKYTDRDSLERITEGYDIRTHLDGRHAVSVGWFDIHAGKGAIVDYPTTVYVMNEAGATVAKYVVIGESDGDKYRLPDGSRSPAEMAA